MAKNVSQADRPSVSHVARHALLRSAVVAAVGQGLVAAGLGFAAVDASDGDRSMFWTLAAGAVLGVLAAVLLATTDRPARQATDRINKAVVAVGIGFSLGALAALLGKNPLVLAVPVVFLFVNGMLVGAARKAQQPAGRED